MTASGTVADPVDDSAGLLPFDPPASGTVLTLTVAGVTAIVTELTVTPVSPAAALPLLLSSLLLAGAVSRSRSS